MQLQVEMVGAVDLPAPGRRATRRRPLRSFGGGGAGRVKHEGQVIRVHGGNKAMLRPTTIRRQHLQHVLEADAAIVPQVGGCNSSAPVLALHVAQVGVNRARHPFDGSIPAAVARDGREQRVIRAGRPSHVTPVDPHVAVPVGCSNDLVIRRAFTTRLETRRRSSRRPGRTHPVGSTCRTGG